MIDKYLVVKNFLDESERKLLSSYLKIYLRNNFVEFDFQDGAAKQEWERIIYLMLYLLTNINLWNKNWVKIISYLFFF